MTEKELSKKSIVQDIENLRNKVNALGQEKSTLLKIAQESFILGSDSHLNSLNPEIREQLGLELAYLTQRDPKLSTDYTEKKNKYLSLGKSYASISFLFDLVDEHFSLLDLILLQEILMNDGEFRKVDVFIVHPDGKKIVYDFKNILGQLEETFDWYYSTLIDSEISPVVTAILFHYKVVSIHPFLDGNGRISRLILNLILLKHGLFPISIPNEKRKQYYESLVLADSSNIEPLIDFFGSLIIEKLNQYLSIAKELEDLDFNKTFLVLTEDGNTKMIENLLEIHGIDISKAKVESYDGKDNLASAIFFAKKLTSKSANLKHILIHRDRDNDNPQQLKQIIEKQLRNYQIDGITTVLITKHYDIESYFLNERHINCLYNQISIDKAKELIEQATIETSEISKSKLRIAYSEYGKYGKINDPQERANEINKLYDSDPMKYRYGKSVLYRLEELITNELGLADRATLTKYSDHLKIIEIEQCKEALN
ncbi:MAG: Fic family protein [Flavobacteriales bacterium]|nr:Fic family protein [Flavobacteriales bacterium]